MVSALSALLLALVPGLGAVQAASLADFPAPERSRVDVVGVDMRLNGIRMSAWELHSELGPSEVLDYYVQHWGRSDPGRPGYTLVPMGDWQLLTHVDESAGLTYTVQVRPDDAGAFALLGVSDLLAGSGQPPQELASDFPVLGGTTVESVLETQEVGWTARTITASNRRSVTANIAHYAKSLGEDGWVVESSVQGRSGSAALSARRGNDSLSVTVFEQDDATRTIAVWEAR
ncbi:hypothetical protein SAMN04488509_105161 [Aquimonas voraii]|uniref:Uncharacterized protein n=2 Tax=Aquimonas voraii TaxID=265719 RepID=A0A1G6WW22_9GAMM|nr:hypothetical protein SAMN04488509_105161 [Aquimonas voraii]